MSKNLHYWVGSPSCDRPTEFEKELIAGRDRLEIIAEISDPDLSHEYDETAVAKLDGYYYLCQTSGCSCPSPSEAWGVTVKSDSLKEIYDVVVAGEYEGYTFPDYLEGNFLAEIEKRL